jgi:hypothetical protein
VDPLLTIPLGVSTEAADKEVSAFAATLDNLDTLLRKGHEIDLTADDAEAVIEGVVTSYKTGFGDIEGAAKKLGISVEAQLGATFTNLKADSGKLMASQREALEALIAGGGEGSEAYERLVEGLRDSVKQQQQFAEASKRTDEVLAQLKAEALGVVDSTDDLGDSLAEVEEKAPPENFMEKIFKAEALEKAGEWLDQIAEKGEAVRDAMAEVQAKTGATPEEMSKLADAASDVYKNVRGISLDEAIKSIGVAKSQLGDLFSDDDLAVITKRAAAIGKAFGKETDEVLGGSRTFIKNFGLGADQAGDLIAFGMQKANTKMDDLLDTTDEYSQIVKQAGFSAEEFIGTLTAGVQAGARDTDKLADAIKETQIRLKAGDISTALQGISGPVAATVQGIVKAGEQGTLSVKEVLQKSAAAVEDAFNAGQISESMRSQLQVAVSGTPAEDIGSELYGRIFSAKIDTDSIRQQAADAAKQIEGGFGNLTVFERLQKGVDAVIAKGSAFAAPFVAGAGNILHTVGQVGPGLDLLDEKFKIFDKGKRLIDGGLLPAVQKIAPSLVATGEAGELSFAGLGASATAAWAAATLGLAVLVGAALYFFTQTEKGKEIIETVGAYISSFGAHATEIFSALGEIATAYLNPKNWFGDNGEKAREEAKKHLAAAVEGAITGAKQKIATSGMDKAIADATTLKADLDKNDKLGELLQKYRTTKNALEKEDIGRQLAQSVPGAIASIHQVVDAGGKIRTVYEINADAAERFYQAQSKTIGGDIQSKQATYLKGLHAQVDQYHANREALAKLGNQIAEQGAKGKDVSELTARYKELEGKVNDGAAAISKSVQEGQKTKLIGKDVSELTTKYGFTKEAVLDVAAAQDQIEQKAKKVVQTVGQMANAFRNSLQALQTQGTDSGDALVTINQNIAKLQQELSDKNRTRSEEEIKQDIANEQKRRDEIIKTGRLAVQQGKDLQKQEFRAQVKIGLAKPDPNDLTATYEGFKKSTSDILFDISQQFAVDDRARQVQALRRGYEGMQKDLGSQFKDISKQISDSATDFTKGVKLKLGKTVISNPTEVRRLIKTAIDEQINAAGDKLEVDLYNVELQFGRQNAEAAVKVQQEILGRQAQMLRDQEALYSDTTETGLRKRLELELEAIDKERDAKLIAIVETDSAVLDLSAQINAKQARLSQTADEDERKRIQAQIDFLIARRQEYKDNLIATNRDAQEAIRDADSKTTAALTKGADDISTARINATVDTAQRERLARLREVQKTHDAELQLLRAQAGKIIDLTATEYSPEALKSAIAELEEAITKASSDADRKQMEDRLAQLKDNARRLADAQRNENEQRIQIERDYLAKTNYGYAAAMDFVAGLEKSLTKTISDEDRKRFEQDAKSLDDKSELNRKAFDQGLQDYAAYVEAQDAIDQERQEKLAGLVRSHSAAMQALQDGTNAAIAGTAKLFLDRQKITTDSVAQHITDKTHTIGEVAGELGQLVAGSAAQALGEQQDIADAIIGTALSVMDKLGQIYIAQAWAIALSEPDSVATFGLTGITRATVITGLVESALAVAHAIAGYREGTDWTGDGPVTGVAGVVHYQEAVIRAPYAASIRREIAEINRGRDPHEVFESSGPAWRRAHLAAMASAPVVSGHDDIRSTSDGSIIAELRQQNTILTEQTRTLAGALEASHGALASIREKAVMNEFATREQTAATKEQTAAIKASGRFWPKGIPRR